MNRKFSNLDLCTDLRWSFFFRNCHWQALFQFHISYIPVCSYQLCFFTKFHVRWPRAIIPYASTLRKYWSSIFPECKYLMSSLSPFPLFPFPVLSICFKMPIQLIQICRFTQLFLVTTIYKTYLLQFNWRMFHDHAMV